MSQLTVWNSQLVQQSIERLRLGLQTDMDCFHERDIELRAGNIMFHLSSEEVIEFRKCSRDIVYFVEKYVRFLTDRGRITVPLRTFQKKILKELSKEIYIPEFENNGPENRNVILMAARQIGKTTTVAAFFTWYLCFHTDRNLAILANRQNTAVEIVSKVIDMFKGLPFFLKPGILNAAAMGLRLDNGCQLMSQATTKTAQIGFAIHVLYADEFAHIPSNIVGDFWRSVYPTLSASVVSQCIISSTPAGQGNLFFDIWDKAVKKMNSFIPIRVDYWEVPGHDEEWAKKMRRDFGEEEFAQEFELQFNVDSRLLLGIHELAFMKRLEQDYEFQVMERSRLDESLYRSLMWKKDFDINKEFTNKDMFVISIDTGDGKEEDDKKDNDSNIIAIFQLKMKSLASLGKLRQDERTLKNMVRLEQVGLYRNNMHDEEVTGKIAKSIIFDQLNENRCIVMLEMNFNGKQVLRELILHENYSENLVFRSHHTKPIPGMVPPKKKPGFKVSMDKEFFCKLGKKMIGEKTLIVNESETIFEFGAFGKDKRGKFRGLAAHDDAVMATLNISRLYNEPIWEDILYDFLDDHPDCEHKRKISSLVEIYEDNSDEADGMFKSLYLQEEESRAVVPKNVLEMFNEGEKRALRYTPGNSFRPKI